MSLDEEIEAARQRLAELEAGDAPAPDLPALAEPEPSPVMFGAYNFADEAEALAELQRRCMGKGLAERNKLVADWEAQQRAMLRPKGWREPDPFADRWVVREWPCDWVV